MLGETNALFLPWRQQVREEAHDCSHLLTLPVPLVEVTHLFSAKDESGLYGSRPASGGASLVRCWSNPASINHCGGLGEAAHGSSEGVDHGCEVSPGAWRVSAVSCLSPGTLDGGSVRAGSNWCSWLSR